jgi:hypothetical protein
MAPWWLHNWNASITQQTSKQLDLAAGTQVIQQRRQQRRQQQQQTHQVQYGVSSICSACMPREVTMHHKQQYSAQAPAQMMVLTVASSNPIYCWS